MHMPVEWIVGNDLRNCMFCDSVYSLVEKEVPRSVHQMAVSTARLTYTDAARCLSYTAQRPTILSSRAFA